MCAVLPPRILTMGDTPRCIPPFIQLSNAENIVTPLIKRAHDALEQIDQSLQKQKIEIEGVRKIDRLTLSNDYHNVEQAITFSIDLINSVCDGIFSSRFFIVNDLDCIDIQGVSSTRILKQESTDKLSLKRVKFVRNLKLFEDFDSAPNFYIPIQYPTKNLIGIYEIEPIKTNIKKSELSEELRKILAIVNQIVICVNSLYDNHIRESSRIIWEKCMRKQTSPGNSYEIFLKEFNKQLPRFFETNILDHSFSCIIANTETNIMYMRASTGELPSNLSIPKMSSTTGRALNQSEPIFFTNPRESSGPFLNFSASQEKPICEVVVQILDTNNDIIGLLNYEFLNKRPPRNYMNIVYHISNTLRPIFVALEGKWDNSIYSSRGYERTTALYLGHTGKLVRHETIARLQSIRSVLRAFPDKDRLQNDALIAHEEIMRGAKIIEEFIMDTTHKLENIAVRRNINVRNMIDRCWGKFFGSLDIQSPIKISMENRVSSDIHIYANDLLEIFIHALFDNSRRMFVNNRRGGTIRVFVTKEVIEDGADGVEYHQIHIRDNGPGVSKSELEQLREFIPGTRFREDEDGTGYAVVGLQRYLLDLGGHLQLDSVKGRFFDVQISLPISTR